MSIKIPRCYDSHCHFLATGQIQKGLKLFNLTRAEDVSHLHIEPHHFRGEWLVGFGWDEHKWLGQAHHKLPSKEILDRYFPDFPVMFSRGDGHACWINSRALKILKKPAHHTGIFVDNEHIEILSQIPKPSEEQFLSFLVAAQEYFLKRGFTHIRDMSCSLEQWQWLRERDQKKQLKLYIEENFTCENIHDFQRALKEALKAMKLNSPHLKVRGVKLYLDGALGSGGAFLSTGHGSLLWPMKDVEEVLTQTWKQGLEVSIHAIGDQSAHLVAQLCTDLKSKGVTGKLNIEHGQVIRTQTIELLSDLDVVVHMQPCHWLSDRYWLKEKLGALYKYAFPWRELESAGVAMQFGSDAPIEEASVLNNLQALEECSTEGIAGLKDNSLKYFSHPDKSWGAECKSLLDLKTKF